MNSFKINQTIPKLYISHIQSFTRTSVALLARRSLILASSVLTPLLHIQPHLAHIENINNAHKLCPILSYQYATCFHLYICPIPLTIITMPFVSISTPMPTVPYQPYAPFLLSLCPLFPWLLCPFFIPTVSTHMPLCPLFHILLPMHNFFPRLTSSLFFCFYAISCFILICCPVKGLLVSSLLHNHLLALLL